MANVEQGLKFVVERKLVEILSRFPGTNIVDKRAIVGGGYISLAVTAALALVKTYITLQYLGVDARGLWATIVLSIGLKLEKCRPMFNSQRNQENAAETAAYYDHLWSTLGTKLDYTEINRVRFLVEGIREFVDFTELKILDFGCGRGWMTPFLSPLGSVTGIDFSPAGIQFARENYGEHASFLLADAASPTLGLPAGARFDVVVCSEVIEHVPEHLALLRQVARFLRPDGWCMLTTPNGNVWPQFRRDPRFITQLQPVENWVTTRQLVALFRQAGFRIVRHEGRPVYEFRIGFTGWLQLGLIEMFFRRLGLYHLWGRLILPTALYQMVATQKIS